MNSSSRARSRRSRILAGAILFLLIGVTFAVRFRESAFAADPPPPTYYTLTINRTGDGGTVYVDPPAITVSTFPWDHSYLKGTRVDLEYQCVSPWMFKEWAGPVEGIFLSDPHVEMDANKTIGAVFVEASISIYSVELCVDTDQVAVTLGGEGLSGFLELEAVAANRADRIYMSSGPTSAGTHTVSFSWAGVPINLEYTSLRATWSPCTSVTASHDAHFMSLGGYKQSQYNVPLESHSTCESSDADVCFTNNQCNYWHDTLRSLFAEQANRNGSGTSINHGTVKREFWCQENNHPPPPSCNGHFIFREFYAPRTPSCSGGWLGNDTVARSPYNNLLACGDRVYIVGIGEKTVTDQGGGLIEHQLDNFTESVACTGIGDLVPWPPGAVTLKLY